MAGPIYVITHAEGDVSLLRVLQFHQVKFRGVEIGIMRRSHRIVSHRLLELRFVMDSSGND